jgi:hypothetical protein
VIVCVIQQIVMVVRRKSRETQRRTLPCLNAGRDAADGVGELRRHLGDFTAHLRVTGQLATETVWIRMDGVKQAGVPAPTAKSIC